MMSDKTDFLDVKILGREYRVACPPAEQEALQAAVHLVDERMQEASKARNITPERAAVMAALNIAHEYLGAPQGGKTNFDNAGVKRRIKAMDARLEALLTQQELGI
ncbi:MAG: cell division protein ZapA [Zoogloeaceae bacterium]|jgi:cell division protein ZapA|nr:cell division protein ZapA [Zoogloeaceae bacterium]